VPPFGAGHMTNETLQTIAQAITAVGLVLAALGGYGAYYFGHRIEKEKQQTTELQEAESKARAAQTGVLQTQKQHTETMILDPAKGAYPILEFGDSGAMFLFAGPQGAPIFKFAGENQITIVKENGEVKVSATIRDRSGKVVAELVKNEWKVNPQKSWDRNYTADALEVRDSAGEVVLQVRALPDRIQFQAKLYDATGMGIAFVKSDMPGQPGGLIDFARPPGGKFRVKIAPMFKYPSERHLGEPAPAGA
jgi:hypothetical protein